MSSVAPPHWHFFSFSPPFPHVQSMSEYPTLIQPPAGWGGPSINRPRRSAPAEAAADYQSLLHAAADSTRVADRRRGRRWREDGGGGGGGGRGSCWHWSSSSSYQAKAPHGMLKWNNKSWLTAPEHDLGFIPGHQKSCQEELLLLHLLPPPHRLLLVNLNLWEVVKITSAPYPSFFFLPTYIDLPDHGGSERRT